jgi:hypothetical protein
MKIRLARGETTLVDEEDWERVSEEHTKNWHLGVRGYVMGWSKTLKKMIYLHQAIMREPPGPGLTVDHIDQDPLNNLRTNLRWATKSLQMRNKRVWGKSKFRGVCWHKSSKKWLARIKLDGKYKHLGYFLNEKDAARAVMRERKKAFPTEPYAHEQELCTLTICNFFGPANVYQK